MVASGSVLQPQQDRRIAKFDVQSRRIRNSDASALGVQLMAGAHVTRR
jgi:hypothetical protein